MRPKYTYTYSNLTGEVEITIPADAI
jgi:hypothetical protein